MGTTENPLLAICVGVARSGTSTLYALMRRHPSVCVSNVKETEFFWRERHAKGRDFYLRTYFPHRGTRPALFEASPIYIDKPVCLERLRKHCPDARIIVMLRNPVDRAFSDYLFYASFAYYDEPFEVLCERDVERLRDIDAELDFKSMDRSRYSRQIRGVFRHFPREQVHFVVFEDFMRDQRASFLETQRWLGLPLADVDDIKSNEARRVRNASIARLLYNPKWRGFRQRVRRITRGVGAGLLHTLVSTLNRASFAEGEKPRLASPLRARLLDAFENEIVDVEALTGLDLSHWRSKAGARKVA